MTEGSCALDWDSFAVVSVNDTPTTANWQFEPLVKGREHWKIGFCASQRELIIEWLRVEGGAASVKRVPVVPKANRTLLAQALQEARYRHGKKIRSGYCAPGAIETALFTPQLAEKFKEQHLTPERFRIGIAIQAKFDGERCIPVLVNDAVVLRTRTNKEIPCPLHVLKQQLRVFLSYLPDGVPPDGELYSHSIPFQKLQKVLQKGDEEREGADSVRFCVFDIADFSSPLEVRINTLLEAYSAMVADGHPCDRICLARNAYANSRSQLDMQYERFLAEGFEGAMLRQLAGPRGEFWNDSLYVSKRSRNLIKMKPCEDAEAEVIEVIEAAREPGTATFRLRTPDGIEFACRPAAPAEQRRRWLEKPEEVLGRSYTYKYQGTFDGGVPRFPTGKGFR